METGTKNGVLPLKGFTHRAFARAVDIWDGTDKEFSNISTWQDVALMPVAGIMDEEGGSCGETVETESEQANKNGIKFVAWR